VRRLAVTGVVATAAILVYVAIGPGGPATTAPGAASVAPSPAVGGSQTPDGSAAEPRKIVGAAHVLVAYRGALRAPPSVDRSKDEARKRAEEALALLRSGKASFGDIVTRYSDDPSTQPSHGDIGNFERLAMPDAFSEAAFGMKVGETSGVVETPLGFHIIQRTR
jgi:hypothetical protein